MAAQADMTLFTELPKELGNSVDFSALEAGQTIDVMVLGDSIERGLLILSLKRANQIKSLNALNSNFDSGEVMTVRPTEANKWGLLVDIDGLKGFIPVSQLTPLHYPRVEGADPEKILEHLYFWWSWRSRSRFWNRLGTCTWSK